MFRLVLAEHRHKGWQLVPTAEWCLFILRHVALPPGSSSEPVDGYDHKTGEIHYLGEPLSIGFAGLALLASPTSPTSTAGKATYGELSSAIAKFLKVAVDEAGPTPLPVFDLSDPNEQKRLSETLMERVDPRQRPADPESESDLEEALQRNDESMRRRFIQELKACALDEFLAFAHALLTAMGFPRVSFERDAPTENERSVIGRALRRRGDRYVTVRILLARQKLGEREIRCFLRDVSSTQTGLIISVGSLTKGAREATSSKARLIDADEVTELAQKHALGLQTSHVEVLRFDPTVFTRGAT